MKLSFFSRHAGVAILIMFVLSSCARHRESEYRAPVIDDSEYKLVIASYMVPCVGVGVRLCMLEKRPNDTEWKNRYSQIEGFKFTWGVESELIVRHQALEDVPADAASLKTVVVALIDETQDKPETLYQWPKLQLHDGMVQQQSESLFKVLGANFGCADGALCESLLSASGTVSMTFSYTGGSVAPIELRQWQQTPAT